MFEFRAAEFPLTRRPALPFAPVKTAAVNLEAVSSGSILQILGKPFETRADEICAHGAFGPDADLRFMSPGQWLLVTDEALSAQYIAALERRLAGLAYIVDQTHGRSRIRLSGPAARSVLARGTAVDVHPNHFAIGSATGTAFGHMAVNLARTGDDTFELLVLRGFAESLWEEVAEIVMRLGVEPG